MANQTKPNLDGDVTLVHALVAILQYHKVDVRCLCTEDRERENMESDIMENISTLLEDQSVITYKWLSKEISVGYNKAKVLLKKYLDQHGKQEKIHATYCIIGSEKNEESKKNQKILIVRDCDVDQVKSRMHSVSSQHVYSIQKAQMMNSSALYTIDLELAGHNFKIEPTAPQAATTFKIESSVLHLVPLSTNELKSTKINEIKNITKKEIKKEEPMNKHNNKNVKTPKSTDKAPTFFSSNHKPKKPSPPQKVVIKTEINLAKRMRPSTSSTNKNGKSYQRIKRPRVDLSSSDESGKEEEDDEDPFVNEDYENPLPEESPPREEKPESNKPAFVSKNEVVNETFVDDDGYLVTKKTVKRIEEPVKEPIKKPATNLQTKAKPKAAPKKPLANKKNVQQSTLTSFFKKN